MKRILILLSLALILSSCGQEPKSDPCTTEMTVSVNDPSGAIKTVFNRFEYEAHIRGVKLEPKQVTIVILRTPDFHGLCIKSPDENHITILIDHNLEIIYLEELLFHELAHGLLYRKHTYDKHPDGRPKSMMYDPGLLKMTYWEHREEYLNELFKIEQ